MADELKRYSPAGAAIMQEMHGGNYVKADDYDALRAERDALVDMLADAFGWEDRSYAHAVMHADNAIKNLRAEVAKYRGMEVENAGLRTDNEGLRAEIAALKDENQKMHHDWMADHAELEHLKDELAHPEPMVPLRLVEDIAIAFQAAPKGGHDEMSRWYWSIDAAIRAAREGER